jgi:hypothetical protein
MRLSVHLERLGSCTGDGGLAVTTRLKEWLKMQWGVDSETLHDKAPSFFKPVNAVEVREQK